MPNPRFLFPLITFCLFILSSLVPNEFKASPCQFVKTPNNAKDSLLSKKKGAVEYTLTDDEVKQTILDFIEFFHAKDLVGIKCSRTDSNIDKRFTAYSDINYLKTFNPISTYSRLSNVMSGVQHNIMLKLSSTVIVYIHNVESFS
jgi:hypothetical protein